MRQFDKDNDEYYLECDNQFKGCSDKIWQVGDRELCTDCAFDEVFNADKGEQFLIKPLKVTNKIRTFNNNLTVYGYVFSEQEIMDILKKAADELKNSGPAGYIKYENALKECIENNVEKDDFLEEYGYECIQEGWD